MLWTEVNFLSDLDLPQRVAVVSTLDCSHGRMRGQFLKWARLLVVVILNPNVLLSSSCAGYRGHYKLWPNPTHCCDVGGVSWQGDHTAYGSRPRQLPDMESMCIREGGQIQTLERGSGLVMTQSVWVHIFSNIQKCFHGNLTDTVILSEL